MKFISWIWRPLRWGFVILGLLALAVASMLAFPLSNPTELGSIHTGAMAIDRTDLPALSPFQARDGSLLAYRFYPSADGNTDRIALMIHGSAEGSTVMNEMAKKFAAENSAVVAPDIRGHGASGTHGDIAYLGQLDDDAEDLVAELRRQYPKARLGLVGFSAGGSFALRLAGGRLATAFDRVVLISPALGPFAPSTRPISPSSHWVNIDMPRALALSALQRLGFPCCDALPIVAFATAHGENKFVTSQYSYRLSRNFGASFEYDAAFHNLVRPTTILVGAQDELMAADRYNDIVRGIEPKIDVEILPGLGHMDMVHAPASIEAVLKAFRQVTSQQQDIHTPAQSQFAHAVIAADKYAEIVQGITVRGNMLEIDARILPGLDHIDMLHTAPAIEAVRTAFKE
jgi:pimeloyl-ACP methyl ester carboxylesterase